MFRGFISANGEHFIEKYTKSLFLPLCGFIFADIRNFISKTYFRQIWKKYIKINHVKNYTML